ncbi:SDR family NAD(P)-dependent oxidoreductase [Histidinibacterium lentulum]|uniref:SDR family oxidoreductase n=1 Tax=Histidinibacterium lentulum TaxID=2480588 RepID=A0A3N2QLR6_9RHOB|nr:SDR family oxidoreductase [Histidinibacterium lentulum]ROT96121.1 SDR family oxidoreductase [Histidinibacterium lentulum]
MTDSRPAALITGASRGLGAAIALALAPTHHVVACARTVGALEELDDRIRAAGGEATLAPMDITVDAAMQQLCRSIFERWGRLALWVHTAVHAAPMSPAAHVAEKELTKSLSVNVEAAARLIRYTAPLLGAEGRAVFLADPQGGRPFHAAYGATKAAQIAMAESWREETRKTGPQVAILEPRPMPTATRARFHPGEDRGLLTPPEAEAARLLPAILG